MDKKITVYVGVILAMVFWSLAFIWEKEALDHFKPFTIIFLRLVVATTFLFAIAGISKKMQQIKQADVKWFLLLALFEPILYFIGETTGLLYVSPIIAAVLISLVPLLVPIFAFYFLKERITIANLTGILISVIGVAMVLINKNFSFDVAPIGIALIGLSVFAAIGYTIMVRKLTNRYTPLTITAYQNLYGLLAFFPLFLIVDFQEFKELTYTVENISLVIKLAIFGSCFSFILFAHAITKIGVNEASIFGNAIPVFTAVLAYFMLGDELSPQKIFGIFIVITGLFISQMNFSKIKQKLVAKRV